MQDSTQSGPSDALRALLDRSLSGSYRIEQELGGGGMSRVFLAEECALGRRVVIKVLSSEIAHELSAERFAREIRLSARLQHPNIVSVLSAGAVDGVPFYTMPFIEGESLRARLSRLGVGERVPYTEAVGVLRDVARALAYANGLGVVHRDIKPENVLLGNDAAVVADFGVAKAMAAARTFETTRIATAATQGGAVLGTPAYMSPEQAAGDPTLDHRSDGYAWGLLAYELLSGAHPFADRRSARELITAHLVDAPRPLSEAAPHVPPPLAALVMRCLAKNPADRPTGVRDIVETLTGSTADERAESRDSGAQASHASEAAPALSRTSARWRTGALAIAALVVVTIGAGLVWVARRTPSEPPGPAARVSVNSAAYDAYLRGKVRVSSENSEDNDAAIRALRQSIAADAAFAPAYAELARAYAIKVFYYATDAERKTLTEDAEVAVEKALSIDPGLGEAYFARGLLLWTPGKRFPHDLAMSAYRQALVMNPNLDEAHHQLAVVLFHVGLLDEAQVEIEKALALNAGNTLARFRLGVIAMYRGDYERAYAVFNSTPLGRNPALWAFQTATALFRLGREREATDLIDKFLRESPKDEGGVGHSVRAMMLAKAGRVQEARGAIAETLTLGRDFGHFHHSAYNIASAYALLGENEQAIHWLQDAVENGFPCYPLFATDRQLDGLRKDPQFIAFLAKLRRDWESRKRAP